MRKNKIGVTKLVNKYQNLAYNIDQEVEVYINDNTWYCEPENKEIYISQPKPEKESLKDFLHSVDIKLNQEQKYLLDIIPPYVWSFLHEMGHLQTEKKIYIILNPLRKITDFLSFHFSHKNQLMDKITTLIYYNMLDEVKATQWAVNYVIQNEKQILQYSKELAKIYKNYFKKSIDKI